jgi:hypothetical protein
MTPRDSRDLKPADAMAVDELPVAALNALPQLHGEATRTTSQAGFLDAAVNAAGALVLLAMATLTFAAGTALKPCFVWSVLVLLAVCALLRSYIRSTAAAFDRVPMAQAARELRAILLYAGLAWGAGAFLVLAPDTSPLAALLFAALPSLTLSLLLKDREGALAFLAPVTAVSIAAAILQSWPDNGLAVALLLLLQSAIAAHALLRGRQHGAGLPAGLALR